MGDEGGGRDGGGGDGGGGDETGLPQGFSQAEHIVHSFWYLDDVAFVVAVAEDNATGIITTIRKKDTILSLPILGK